MVRQKLLFLYTANSSLESRTIGFSLYDGSGAGRFEAHGEEQGPPYPSVLAAMRDGWRVLQVPVLQSVDPGPEQRPSYLRFEFVLEQLVEVQA